MEKTFGNKDRFAIEFKWNETEYPHAYNVAMWVGGIIATGEAVASATDIHTSFQTIVNACGRRDDCALFGITDEKIFAAFDSNLMGRSDGIVSGEFLPEDYWRFNLWFHHALGRFHIIAISCGSDMKIIIGDISPRFIKAIILGVEEVERAIADTNSWIHEVIHRSSI